MSANITMDKSLKPIQVIIVYSLTYVPREIEAVVWMFLKKKQQQNEL